MLQAFIAGIDSGKGRTVAVAALFALAVLARGPDAPAVLHEGVLKPSFQALAVEILGLERARLRRAAS